MRLLQKMQKIKELCMSTREKQQSITVSEVYHLWNHLISRYDVILVTDTLQSFVRDDDLKAVLKIGRKVLNKNIKILEKEMMEYGIPLPLRPPKQATITENIEHVSDRHIFRRILRGIQEFLPTHIMAFIHSTSPKIRELFLTFLYDEMKLYDKYLEYGKLKGYVIEPPLYR